MLYIIGGIIIYLIGIFGINFLFGRYHPYDYQMDTLEGIGTVLWPISIILAIPIGIVGGITILAIKVRENEAKKKKALLQAEQERQQLAHEVQRMDFFEDGVPGL
jgi:hypothetical protein